ncbi:MAG: YciI family protein [Actinomycetia bacterium]|nr:YciI family protein [Actinomycetes bacterium]
MTMFLVLYRSSGTAARGPEQPTAEGIAAWSEWARRAGEAVVHLGSPCGPASATADPSIAGYSVLQANDADALRQLLAGHPHAAMGGGIEAYELFPLPDAGTSGKPHGN